MPLPRTVRQSGTYSFDPGTLTVTAVSGNRYYGFTTIAYNADTLVSDPGEVTAQITEPAAGGVITVTCIIKKTTGAPDSVVLKVTLNGEDQIYSTDTADVDNVRMVVAIALSPKP